MRCCPSPLLNQAAYNAAVGKVQELAAQLQESDNHKQQLQQELESAKVTLAFRH